MNDVVKAVIGYSYQNSELNRRIAIYHRTRKKRIKNKQFSKILFGAVKERKVIRCGELVLLEPRVFSDLKRYETLAAQWEQGNPELAEELRLYREQQTSLKENNSPKAGD